MSCLPQAVITKILCLFGSERIQSGFLSGRDDDYLVDSSLEQFVLEEIVSMCFLSLDCRANGYCRENFVKGL